MLNIVVPMAGRGSRFSEVGYTQPKPLIPVMGRPMIQWVIENLTPRRDHRFIFICQKEHVENYGLEVTLSALAPGCKVIPIEGITEGAACTVLLASEYINNPDAMMIANCDQYIDASIDAYLDAMDSADADGLIMTMKADDPKWSFVGLDDAGTWVTTVVEKQVISDEATVGIYNFRRGADFVRAAQTMIARDLRVNNEFYVAPTYNQLIAEGARIAYHNIGAVNAGMYGLGTPADLTDFLALPRFCRRSCLNAIR